MSYISGLFCGGVLIVENVDVVEIAGHAVDVEAIADDKLFWYFKTYVVGVDGHLKSLGLEQEGGYAHRCGVHGLDVGLEAGHGVAGVDDVLYDDYVASGYVVGQTHNLLYDTCRAHALIALEAYEGNLGIYVEGTEEVDGKGGRAVEHAHEQGVFTCIVRRYKLAETRHPGAYGFMFDEGTKCETLICLSFHLGKFGCKVSNYLQQEQCYLQKNVCLLPRLIYNNVVGMHVWIIYICDYNPAVNILPK